MSNDGVHFRNRHGGDSWAGGEVATRDTHGVEGFSPTVTGMDWGAARDGEQRTTLDIAPGSIDGNQLQDGVVDGAVHIIPATLSMDLFAETIVPPRVLDALPALPDAEYAEGSLVFLTTDGKLYRQVADAWTVAVDAVDIVADWITAGAISVGAIGADELAAGAVTTEKLHVGPRNMVLERFSYDFSEEGDWSQVAGGGTFTYETVTDAQSGNGVQRSVGYTYMEWGENIPYDPNALYRIHVRVRQTVEPVTGGSGLYAGVVGVGSDGVTRVNISGSDTVSSQHYIASSGATLDTADGWVDFVGYFTGTGGSPGGLHQSATDPATLHADVRYFRPMFTLGYNGTDGTAEIDYYDIQKLDITAVKNSTSEVLIDSDGITILNGKINLLDQFGASALTALGFQGSLRTFIQSGGLYNADFAASTVSILSVSESSLGETTALYEASLSSALPFWVVSEVPGTGALRVRSDPTTPSGRYLRFTWSSGTDEAEIYQDIPINRATSGDHIAVGVLGGETGAYEARYGSYTISNPETHYLRIRLQFAEDSSAARITLLISERDNDHGIIGSETAVAVLMTAAASAIDLAGVRVRATSEMDYFYANDDGFRFNIYSSGGSTYSLARWQTVGDPNPMITFEGDPIRGGRLMLGDGISAPDVVLRRDTMNTLLLESGDDFKIESGSLYFGSDVRLNSETNALRVLTSAGGAQYMKTRGLMLGTSYIYAPLSEGIQFGADVSLSRASPNVLSLGTNDRLDAPAVGMTVDGGSTSLLSGGYRVITGMTPSWTNNVASGAVTQDAGNCLVAGSAGTYLITGAIELANTIGVGGNWRIIGIGWANSTHPTTIDLVTSTSWAPHGGYMRMSGTWIVRLGANDHVRLFGYHDGGGTHSSSRQRFAMTRIGS